MKIISFTRSYEAHYRVDVTVYQLIGIDYSPNLFLAKSDAFNTFSFFFKLTQSQNSFLLLICSTKNNNISLCFVQKM